MTLARNLYLKWIDSAHASGMSFTVTNMCMVSFRDSNKAVTGLTVFEPRSLDQKFFARLSERVKNAGVVGEYTLYLPLFLKHKIETLKGDLKIEIIFTSFLEVKERVGTFAVRDHLKVVSVDDSPVILKLLRHTMDEFGFVYVAEQVSDPTKAVEVICRHRPDVVTMDIQMPNMTGVDVVKALLAKEEIPVIMISSLNLEDGSLVFEALNAGAFDYIQKPKLEEKSIFSEELKTKLLLAVEGRSRHSALRKYESQSPDAVQSKIEYPSDLIWCIGSSTGGTQALTRVFTGMPAHIPPTLIVQHIPPVFSKAFAESLNNLCPFTVKEAADGDELKSDHVYIAAGGMQMAVESRLGKLFIALKDDEPVNRFKPSVDYLFNSVVKITNRRFVAGILTGMGGDGAKGLLALKNAGAQTFAQDEASSIVFGMPRMAIELGAAQDVVPLDKISRFLLTKSQKVLKAS